MNEPQLTKTMFLHQFVTWLLVVTIGLGISFSLVVVSWVIDGGFQIPPHQDVGSLYLGIVSIFAIYPLFLLKKALRKRLAQEQSLGQSKNDLE